MTPHADNRRAISAAVKRIWEHIQLDCGCSRIPEFEYEGGVDHIDRILREELEGARKLPRLVRKQTPD